MEYGNIQFESVWINTQEYSLHLKRIVSDKTGIPVFMVHGSIENGKIFYSSSGKGLAPFLASKGYDVFVADLRGRGESKPSVNSNSDFGLEEILETDFPLYINKIQEIKGSLPQVWVSHSWGGVLMMAYLAKKINDVSISSMVFFGTKRRISIFSLKKLFMIDFSWNLLAKLFIKIYGYLPAKKLKLGSDDETKNTHHQTNHWVISKKWLHWKNGFDYKKALQNIKLPPITGANDSVLGHPKDVQELMHEASVKKYVFKIIGKKQGHLHDYDHITLLTHPDAPKDHFVEVLNFIESHKIK
jgi:predicted alpha/beta hydrolase